MSEKERDDPRNFETLRHLGNGLPPNYKMGDINKAIDERKI